MSKFSTHYNRWTIISLIVATVLLLVVILANG